MKFSIKTVITALVIYLAQLFLPFWGVALAAFIISTLIHTNGYISFTAGFLGAFLVWVLSSFIIDLNSLSTLTDRVGEMLSLNSTLLILITGAVGGLLGGFGALCGTMLINLTKKKRAIY